LYIEFYIAFSTDLKMLFRFFYFGGNGAFDYNNIVEILLITSYTIILLFTSVS